MVQISFISNDSGLPDDAKMRLFQPFVSTKKTGVGIQLSICYNIFTARDGYLWSEANPKEGTIFRLTLSAEQSYARTSNCLCDR
jgi:signal transduction histidine kinase